MQVQNASNDDNGFQAYAMLSITNSHMSEAVEVPLSTTAETERKKMPEHTVTALSIHVCSSKQKCAVQKKNHLKKKNEQN